MIYILQISRVLISAIWLAAAISARAQVPDSTAPVSTRTESNAEIEQQIYNPFPKRTNLAFLFNFDYAFNGNQGYRKKIEIQPIVPVTINRRWSMMVRSTLPLIKQHDVKGETEQNGFGDVELNFIFSPNVLGKRGIIWGVGPRVILPTAYDEHLGSEKLELGPSAALIKIKGPWTFSLLAYQSWSVAGADDRPDVEKLYFKPSISHTSKNAFTIKLAVTNTNNLKTLTTNGDIVLGIAKLVRYGQQPISLGINGKTFFGPAGNPTWGWRFTSTFVFPAGEMRK